MKCASCAPKDCTKGKDCPSSSSLIEAKYKAKILEIAEVASFIEAAHYMMKTRLEELVEFAKVMG